MSTMTDEYRDRLARMREEADEGNPEAWQPEREGDDIGGTVVGLETAHTKFGPTKVLVLDTGGVKRSVWLFHTALRNQLKRHAPAIGEFVYIRWNGKRMPESGGSEYDDYSIRVDRPKGTQVDWASVGSDEIVSRVVYEQPTRAEHEAAMERYAPPPGDEDVPF